MMYCPNCGKKNNDNCKFCTECGTKLEEKENNKVYNPTPNTTNSDDTGSGWWFVLGFFFQLVGLILFLVWNKTSPKNAKKVGLGALIGFISRFVLSFIGILLIVFITGSAISSIENNNYTDYSDCRSYCGEGYEEIDGTCYCNNGEKYYIGEDESSDYYIKESIGDISLYNWYNDITTGSDVVTVIALSRCPHCKDFKPVIESLAEENNLDLYIFDIDLLSEEDQSVLKNTIELKDYIGSSPYTFVTSNGEFVDSLLGYYDKDSTMKFLTSTGIIN